MKNMFITSNTCIYNGAGDSKLKLAHDHSDLSPASPDNHSTLRKQDIEYLQINNNDLSVDFLDEIIQDKNKPESANLTSLRKRVLKTKTIFDQIDQNLQKCVDVLGKKLKIEDIQSTMTISEDGVSVG